MVQPRTDGRPISSRVGLLRWRWKDRLRHGRREEVDAFVDAVTAAFSGEEGTRTG
jgi:hypothetical protein